MVHQVLIAGFGGQGVLTCGQILALAATREGKKVTWMPSYGPEQRGGTASCVITLSDRPIGSPLAEKISVALIFNEPSLVKFEPQFGAGTLVILNSCMIPTEVKQFELPVHRVPADDIAQEIGLRRAGNIVMLGAYIAVSNTVSLDAAQEAIGNYLGPSKQHLLETNQKALSAGWRFIDGGGGVIEKYLCESRI
ncbi:MAG: 2-oxoacid:acceptor oxidoreductase family protein [Deltaproteobacteria bacterium]|nr:2-oxoacid:acceptor oxidoreductase family protein [Deltaproteobacteria bacterium]